jgi:hypothetical protein
MRSCDSGLPRLSLLNRSTAELAAWAGDPQGRDNLPAPKGRR